MRYKKTALCVEQFHRGHFSFGRKRFATGPEIAFCSDDAFNMFKWTVSTGDRQPTNQEDSPKTTILTRMTVVEERGFDTEGGGGEGGGGEGGGGEGGDSARPQTLPSHGLGTRRATWMLTTFRLTN